MGAHVTTVVVLRIIAQTLSNDVPVRYARQYARQCTAKFDFHDSFQFGQSTSWCLW